MWLLPLLRTMVLDHGAARKPLYLTGHSAGGAIATVVARLLDDAGVSVAGTYVFGSPRVGDRNWADSFDFPVYRFEYQDDLVVHLPPPPSIMNSINGTFDMFLPVLHYFMPQLFAAQSSMEYVHTGKLYFVDWDEELTVVTSGLFQFLDEAFDLLLEDSPIVPMPKSLASATRVATIIQHIADQFEDGRFHFLRHHSLPLTVGLLTRLLTGRP